MDQISALALLVDKKLTAAGQHSPGADVIGEVLQVVYTTSMKREESEPLRCSVVYLNPATKNDAEAPSAETWNAFPLTKPLPFDTRNLAKVSHSADPACVILAVFPDDVGKLAIWGLVDQAAVHSLRIASWETNRAEGTPGDFHVVVNGVADITVFHALNILGALKQDTVVERYDDVLNVGPVCKYVQSLANPHLPQLTAQFPGLPEEIAAGTFAGMLQAALSRTLLNIQRYKHGGALLISGEPHANLNPKYGLAYDRLPRALSSFAAQALREDRCNHLVYDHYLAENKSMPVALFKEHLRSDFGVRACMSEMAGCVKFIGSLSRVDGLILMDKGLVVRGFGAEIVNANEITTIHVAGDEECQSLREVQASEYGTRHRSMFRYCNAHDDSLGFVVSQDGLVRAVKKVDDKLVMWENVQVMLTIDDGQCTEMACPHCRVEMEGGCDDASAPADVSGSRAAGG